MIRSLWPWTGVVICAAALICASCAGARAHRSHVDLHAKRPVPYPGPPTVVTLVLRYDAGRFTLVNSSARRDNVARLDVEEHRTSLEEGEVGLFEYRLLSARGELLGSGMFLVPLKAETAYEPPDEPHRVIHEKGAIKDNVVAVSVPYSRRASSIQLYRVTPTKSAKVSDWRRTLLDKLPLRTAKAR